MMNITSGMRNSIPVKKIREPYNSNYLRNNTLEYKNRMNNATNDQEIYYKQRNSNQEENAIGNKTAKKIVKIKNTDININRIYRHNNSSENNARKERNNHTILNYIKIINSSNIQNRINNNIKYITINETKNGFVTKKIIKYNRTFEESKVNDTNSPKRKSLRISLIKQGRNKINYILVKNNEKMLSFVRNPIEQSNNIDNKTISRLNSNFLSINENKNNKK